MNEKDIIQPAPADAEAATTPTPDTVITPNGEAAAPADEATEPNNEAAAPADEATEPNNEAVAAADGATEPNNEAAAAADGATEPTATPETTPASDETAETTDSVRSLPTTQEGIIERLREMAESDRPIERSELEALKQAYYRAHAANVAAARDAHIAAGGTPESFIAPADPAEESFKAQLALAKEKRARALEAAERRSRDNLEAKLAIIEQLKTMASSPDEADKSYDAFKQLTARWKETGPVPPERATELWKTYQLYVEQFYDQLRMGHELRAYDFKKNLETKTRLCTEAEALADAPDPVAAFHRLQQLHQEWRETGPVARELREEIWNRFRTASTAVNKRHQAHFETLKAREEENLVRKTALCERVEAIDTASLTTHAQWDQTTRDILAIQAEWKTIGFTPKKMNTPIFERFRAACDRFFQAKAAHYRATREAQASNLARKTALADEAEALAQSTDWGPTAARLAAMQQEWKTIGPVAHKASEAVWKRFSGACNSFFERRAEATAGERREQEANLETKRAIITRLEALAAAPTPPDGSALRALTDEWNATGHVPFRKKDKLHRRYHDLLTRLYDARRAAAPAADGATADPARRRERLARAYEAKRSEILSYETNLSFVTTKSARGGSLVEEIERKIARLKTELAALADEMATLDASAEAANE